MFVRARDHSLIPLSQVTRLWTDKSGDDQAEIVDVGNVTLAYGAIEDLINAQSNVIPAMDGFRVLAPYYDENDDRAFEAIPVLGWLITEDRGVVPVTLEGVNHGQRQTVPVQYPDGRVSLAMDRDFASFEDFLAAQTDD